MPTAEASLDSVRQGYKSSTEVASSKSENDDILGVDKSTSINRAKRFFGPLWQQFATGTTVTTWSITSVISTKTYVPVLDPVVDPAVLACIPPGYISCAP